VTNYGQKKSIIDSFSLENIEDKDDVQDGIFYGCILSTKHLDWD